MEAVPVASKPVTPKAVPSKPTTGPADPDFEGGPAVGGAAARVRSDQAAPVRAQSTAHFSQVGSWTAADLARGHDSAILEEN
jgi:cell division protein FtsN